MVVTIQMVEMRLENFVSPKKDLAVTNLEYVKRHPNPYTVRKLAEKSFKVLGILRLSETFAV